MNDIAFTLLGSSIIAGAAPIILASIGETINEGAGVINLSLDGTILLSAMVAFAFAYNGHSLFLSFLAGALTGGLIAAIVGSFSAYLKQSQVAVGFVLTLTAKDLAYFFGNPYSRTYGPQADFLPLPLLQEIPLLGEVLFRHSVPVYMSMLVILALVLIHGTQSRSVAGFMEVSPRVGRVVGFLRGNAPAHLGKPFKEE